jgi:hypothetical protein
MYIRPWFANTTNRFGILKRFAINDAAFNIPQPVVPKVAIALHGAGMHVATGRRLTQ